MLSLIVLGSSSSFATQVIDFPTCRSVFFEGVSPIIVNPKLEKNSFNLCNNNFAVKYSGISRTPIYSAAYLTYDSVQESKKLSREDNFHEENRIPYSYRALLTDYRGSGYDRGHMFPNGDSSNRLTQYQSFSLLNIVPQNSKNNQNQWRNVEEAVRSYITKTKQSAYIITGPLYIGSHIKVIGSGVMVPTHIYKVVYYPKLRAASAYVSVNDTTSKTDIVSLNQLQQYSGMIFFPSIRDNSILDQRYNFPLSANAAYKLKQLQTVKGISNVFNINPDSSLAATATNKKYEMRTEIVEDLKNKAIEKGLGKLKNLMHH